MLKRLVIWIRSHISVEQTEHANDGSWESGFHPFNKLPLIEEHKPDGSKRLLEPAEVKALYEPQMGAYILDHELTMINHEMDKNR